MYSGQSGWRDCDSSGRFSECPTLKAALERLEVEL
jgi:hypothetical protein